MALTYFLNVLHFHNKWRNSGFIVKVMWVFWENLTLNVITYSAVAMHPLIYSLSPRVCWYALKIRRWTWAHWACYTAAEKDLGTNLTWDIIHKIKAEAVRPDRKQSLLLGPLEIHFWGSPHRTTDQHYELRIVYKMTELMCQVLQS